MYWSIQTIIVITDRLEKRKRESARKLQQKERENNNKTTNIIITKYIYILLKESIERLFI